ncbi:MAG TPA: metal-sensing transcriptional repressor [Candidatus Portnoybacteria bacterium]|nr:metal-sensing transcriptional repressor [Candidatus Portnoybacteria bacterium]
MEKPIKKDVLKRMSYLTGHLEGVRKMIEEDKYCIEVIKQNQAVVEAIKKVNDLLLENHLNTCATTAIKSKKEAQRKKVIKELLDIYKTSNKK